MSSEPMDYCRLCSSATNLVSMFSGKSRTVRDSLRKMIHENVNIQIEIRDPVTSVCFNCLVDISNFHYFKLHCIQNQEELKKIEVPLHSTKKCKLMSVPVETLTSPDINSTKEIFEWLTSKRVNISDLQNDSKTFADKESQVSQEAVHAFTQCELIKTVAEESQTNNIIKTKSRAIQTLIDSNNTKSRRDKVNDKHHTSLRKRIANHYSQTEPKKLTQKIFVNNIVLDIPTKDSWMQTEAPEVIDKDLQCVIEVATSDNCMQTEMPEIVDKDLQCVIEVATSNSCMQTEMPEVVDQDLQCDLLANKIGIGEVATNDGCVQTEMPKVKHRHLQCDLIKTRQRGRPSKFATFKQTEMPEIVDQGLQCDLPTNIIGEVSTKESCMQTELTEVIDKDLQCVIEVATTSSCMQTEMPEVVDKDLQCVIEVATRISCMQTEMPEAIDQNLQCDLANNIVTKVTRDSYMQTEVPEVQHRNLRQRGRPPKFASPCTFKQTEMPEVVDQDLQSDLSNNIIVKVSTKESCMQTELPEVIDHSLQCDLANNIVVEVATRDSCIQTDTPSEDLQCDLPNNIAVEVATKDSCMQTEMPEIRDKDLQQCDLLKARRKGRPSKIARPDIFKEALPNGFATPDLLNKECQTVPPEMLSVHIQCDLLTTLSGFYTRESFISSPSLNLYSREVDSKLNIKLCLKEEKLSPLEALTIPPSPHKVADSHPANLSDLLQINDNKSDSVKICKLCDKSLYNKREVEAHRRTHMQCRFCKKKFRSLKATHEHINSCEEVKQLNVLPFIDLVKVDEQPGMKEQYPITFNNSP